MIPGIGNIAGSVTDVVLGSSVLIKNGIGVAALVVIVLICLMPLVKLGVLMMLLELAAALLQPVSIMMGLSGSPFMASNLLTSQHWRCCLC